MSKAIKIAVLLNGYESPYKCRIRESFERAILAAALGLNDAAPSIDFFDPIVEQKYPESGNHDLIVLSGGTEDPMGDAPWVKKLQYFLRKTVADSPKQKLLGICWGHQTIHVTFGGTVGGMDQAEMGVTDVVLTDAGRKMFLFAQDRPLKMHEFHKRDVKQPAPGFIRLGDQNQSFVNQANTILTFQGHPELNPELAEQMLDGVPSYMGVDVNRKDVLKQKVTYAHDGIELWKRILVWIKEDNSEIVSLQD